MKKQSSGGFSGTVSEVTLKLLDTLIERKGEEQHWKRAKVRLGIFQIVFMAAAVFYLFISESAVQFSLEMLMTAFQDAVVLFLFLVFISSFILMIHFYKKHEEAEDDYENLRTEIIERCEELWSEPDEWNSRHHVFAYLEREHDINLYYK